MKALHVTIVSDVICPWCYIGKRRFEKAVRALGGEVETTLSWQPFELNPQMPREGMDRKAYRIAKFGSWAESEEMDARIVEVGASEGIAFRFDLMKKAPNTFDAHRLIWFAGGKEQQDETVERLFEAYFTQGADVGDRETLLRIAEACALGREARRFLDSEDGRHEVAEAAVSARKKGIAAVPTFVVNQTHLVSGAQPAEILEAMFRQLLAGPKP